MYAPNPDPGNDWVTLTARAFRRLRAGGLHVSRYLSVGCGCGLDAIAAHRIFESSDLALVDLNAGLLGVARENVLCNCPTLKCADVAIEEADILVGADGLGCFDLVYENLPNIPPGNAEPTGSQMATFQRRKRVGVPSGIADVLLSSHYDFLQQAKRFLVPSGRVLSAIGARVSWSSVQQMFVKSGYEPELVAYEFKEQEESGSVVGAYAAAETADRSFRFYDYDAATAALARRRADMDMGAVDALLPRPLTALESQRRLAEGQRIGHMVFLVAGTPVAAS